MPHWGAKFKFHRRLRGSGCLLLPLLCHPPRGELMSQEHLPECSYTSGGTRLAAPARPSRMPGYLKVRPTLLGLPIALRRESGFFTAHGASAISPAPLHLLQLLLFPVVLGSPATRSSLQVCAPVMMSHRVEEGVTSVERLLNPGSTLSPLRPGKLQSCSGPWGPRLNCA